MTRNGARGGLALSTALRDDRGYDQSDDSGEKDGMLRRSVGLSGWVQATDTLRLGANLHRSGEHDDSDATSWKAASAACYLVDDPSPHSRRHETQGSVWAELSMLDGRLTHRLDYQDTISKQSYEGNPWDDGRTRKLKYRGSYALDGRQVAESTQILSILAERQRDESSTAPDYKRDMSSLALEYRGFFDNGLDLQAGVRRDFNQVFDDATSWNIGLSWQVPDRPFRLHGSAGLGIVNPSYFELYANADYGSTVYRGNPGLKLERNRSIDLGVEYTLPQDRGTLDVTWFRERLTDEIESYLAASNGNVGTYSFRNQGGDSPRGGGGEVAARVRPTDDLDVALNYTYLDVSNPDGSVEIRRPRHALSLSATSRFMQGRAQATAEMRHVGGNYDTRFFGDYSTAELPDHTVVNVSGAFDLSEHVRLTGRVQNLFDQDHSDVWGYASPDRTVWLGLQARW